MIAMGNTILEPGKQKQLIIKEVVKKHLKEAQFKSVGQTFYSVRNDICLAVNIFSSQFNSFSTGYNFYLKIRAYPADTEKKDLKIFNEDIEEACSLPVTEACFLPKRGYLHPYHNSLGYTIGGYRDYAPKVQKYEDIRDYINNDFAQYIIPGLQKIQCRDDYNKCKEEFYQYYASPEICLLRFFSSIQGISNIHPKYNVADFFDSWHITAEEVKANRAIYEQVREWSNLPKHNQWDQLMQVLETNFS